jgi:hypothetical protein
MKYQVGGGVHASTYVGVVEANTPEEAIDRAYETASVSVCHQCATSISDPEVAHLWAEDESGNVTSEPTDHDRLVEAHAKLALAVACIEAAKALRGIADSEGHDEQVAIFDAALAKLEGKP